MTEPGTGTEIAVSPPRTPPTEADLARIAEGLTLWNSAPPDLVRALLADYRAVLDLLPRELEPPALLPESVWDRTHAIEENRDGAWVEWVRGAHERLSDLLADAGAGHRMVEIVTVTTPVTVTTGCTATDTTVTDTAPAAAAGG